jgi:hypothetical protein
LKSAGKEELVALDKEIQEMMVGGTPMTFIIG